ncbi:MAG: IS3 family transposase [Streptosporangiales bacterium]|nr:IS3 family transposase [Streptosporangiales bacterium]
MAQGDERPHRGDHHRHSGRDRASRRPRPRASKPRTTRGNPRRRHFRRPHRNPWKSHGQPRPHGTRLPPLPQQTPPPTRPQTRHRADLEIAVAEYIDWYNNRRVHGELRHLPPAEYEALHVLTDPVTTPLETS